MRRNPPVFLNHWRAKLASLLLAAVLWLAIKHGIAYSPTRPASDTPPPAVTPSLPTSRA